MIMFKGVVFGLLALLGVWAPLNAQVLTLSINGTVTGTQSTVICGSGSAPDCLAMNPSGALNAEFFNAFNL